MAIKEDGREQDDLPAGADNPLPATTSPQIAASKPDSSATILTEDEAERKGDFTALLRIRLANAARETSEHLDINGDGFIAKTLSSGEGETTHGTSLFYGQDEFGGYYAKDGLYHDKFGGYYEPYGYTSQNGSFTSNAGDFWDAETGKVTLANGEERPQTSEVVQQAIENDPTIARDQIKIDTQVAESRETEERKRKKQPPGKKPKLNTAGAAQSAGGGLTYGITVTNDDREVSNIILETRIQEHRDTSKPVTADELQRANEEFLRKKGFIDRARARLSQQIVDDATPDDKDTVTQRGDKPKFRAVSKEEASAKIKSMHVPAGAAKVTKATKATVATPGGDAKTPEDGATAATTDNKTADQKTDATTPGSNWYADARGGYWDEFGGYYDKDGGYWEADGGYWDKYNVYTDVNGGRTWPDGSYLDPKSNFVDKDGCYYMPDGTQIKPPKDMDFKKQMQDAAAKKENWHLPDELKPLLQSRVPAVDLNLKAMAPINLGSLKPLDLTDLKAGGTVKATPVTNVETPIKLDAVPLKLEPVKLGANLTLPPLKLDNGLGSPTAKGTGFSLLDPKQNSTPASTGNNFNVDTSRFQMCTTQGNPKNDFSSFFNNYHTFLTAEKPASETKFYDLSNISLSPTIDPKPQFASLTTPAETKGVVLSPKTVA